MQIRRLLIEKLDARTTRNQLEQRRRRLEARPDPDGATILRMQAARQADNLVGNPFG